MKTLYILLLFAYACQTKQSNQWQALFNGKDLNNWDTYLGPSFDSTLNEFAGNPVGLNNDPLNVFSVAELNGEKVLRISGEQFGGISTQQEYGNYHLQLQFRWGSAKHVPRSNNKRDSGLMYHAVGEQGADNGFWMRSHEFQIQEADCGDYWACAGAVADIKAILMPDSIYQFDTSGNPVNFSSASPNGRYCKKSKDAENASGEWNTLDLYCLGDSSIHVVNGVVVMELNKLRQINDGSEIPLTKGKIQLQSEGAEIFYRNITITNISELPAPL